MLRSLGYEVQVITSSTLLITAVRTQRAARIICIVCRGTRALLARSPERYPLCDSSAGTRTVSRDSNQSLLTPVRVAPLPCARASRGERGQEPREGSSEGERGWKGSRRATCLPQRLHRLRHARRRRRYPILLPRWGAPRFAPRATPSCGAGRTTRRSPCSSRRTAFKRKTRPCAQYVSCLTATFGSRTRT